MQLHPCQTSLLAVKALVEVWTELSLAAAALLKQAWNLRLLASSAPAKLQTLAVQRHGSTTSLQAVAGLVWAWTQPILAALTVL